MVESRLKILHIITGLGQGGAEATLFRVVSNTLAEFEHTIVSLSNESYYAEKFTNIGIKVHVVNFKGLFPFSEFFKLCGIIFSSKAIIVQTWLYKADVIGGISGTLMLKKVIWNLRTGVLRPKASFKSNLALRFCGFLSYLLPSRIISCANSIVEYHRRFGYSSRKFVVVHNGLDLDKFFFDNEARGFFRAKWGVLDSELLLGFVARFHPQKDHITLLRAFGILLDRIPNLKLVLVGKDLVSTNHFFSEHLNELKIASHVILSGQETDIAGVMSALDIHASSSLFGEAFPNVVLESMACGTVAVSTDIGDAGLLISDKRFICQPQNPVMLANEISECIEEKRNKDEFQYRAYIRSKVEKFTIQNTCLKYSELWKNYAHRETK